MTSGRGHSHLSKRPRWQSEGCWKPEWGALCLPISPRPSPSPSYFPVSPTHCGWAAQRQGFRGLDSAHGSWVGLSRSRGRGAAPQTPLRIWSPK